MAVLEARPAAPTTLIQPPGGTRRKPIYVPLKNEPGRLELIDKGQLYIDAQYQRRLNQGLVNRIVANWSWVSCGCLEVSQRPGGKGYFVIDGQHRWQAARALPQVRELPCIVFELDTVRDEAVGFLAANTERRMPTLRDQFNALLVAGDPAAKTLFDLADQYSRRISAPANAANISCVSDCIRLIREHETIFKRIFPLCCELGRGNAIPGRLIRGLCHLERYMPRNETLTGRYWRERLEKIGYETVMLAIKKRCMTEEAGDDRTCAEGILQPLNKRMRDPIVMGLPYRNTNQKRTPRKFEAQVKEPSLL